MSAEPFNSQGGYSAGIPPVDVIDANGNVITNVNTTGNVTANVFYATHYMYANGQPFTAPAAGSNTQVQYNDNGALGASPNFTFISTNNTLTVTNLVTTQQAYLGNVTNVTILGGLNGYFLQTDGAGNLTWAAAGGGGNGTPGGSNTQIQYNDNGTFGGDVDFTFNKLTNVLTVPTVNAVSHITAAGNITSNGYFLGNGSLLSGVIANYANYVGQIVDSSQPNITSLGNLVSLNLDGNINSLGSANFSGDIFAGNITLSRNVTASNATFSSNVVANGNVRINYPGNLRSLGNVNFSGAPNINLGTLSNIHISGGNSGFVLTTDGNSNLYWSSGGGGGGNPGGSNREVQYNKSDAFAGSPFFTYDEDTNTLTVSGNLVANTIQYGSGAYKFAKANVYFATSTTTSNVALVSVNANTVSSMDYTIVATNATTGSRQVSKVSAVMYNEMVNYNEYSTLFVNSLVGDFSVSYDPGNIIVPASVTLHVEPTYSSMTIYKIQMTMIEE